MKADVLRMMQNSADNDSPVWTLNPGALAGDIIACTGFFVEKYDELVRVISEIQNERKEK